MASTRYSTDEGEEEEIPYIISYKHGMHQKC